MCLRSRNAKLLSLAPPHHHHIIFAMRATPRRCELSCSCCFTRCPPRWSQLQDAITEIEGVLNTRVILGEVRSSPACLPQNQKRRHLMYCVYLRHCLGCGWISIARAPWSPSVLCCARSKPRLATTSTARHGAALSARPIEGSASASKHASYGKASRHKNNRPSLSAWLQALFLLLQAISRLSLTPCHTAPSRCFRP